MSTPEEMLAEIAAVDLDRCFDVITQDDEEGLSFAQLIICLWACSGLAAHGLLWRAEYYTRTRRAYLEIAYSRSHKRGKGQVYYRRHWAWLPSKPGTTTSQCTPLASASKADSPGHGGDAPVEVDGVDGLTAPSAESSES